MNTVSYLKKKSRLIIVLLLFSIMGLSYGAEKISSLNFLNRVRRPAGRKTWSMLTGKISHRRRGKPTESVPLYLGILFSRNRTLAQVIVDNTQSYMVGQEYSTKNSATTIIPHNPTGYKKPILAKYGIKPEDLTMSFIYWQFIRELPEVSLKTLNCRIFELTAPDKKEKVRLYISSAYYFPMKVEWIKAKAKTPYRTLQVSDFTKIDDIWLITKIKFYGPGWRSVIDFDTTKAGLSQKNIPKELFKKL
ncbi:MAG: outer membrane lipoprotein-sorting protein [Victivallaceae bacterium]|nr:outer membrane lipoprotein-sorting protein [Victivallaceae bacterium]